MTSIPALVEEVRAAAADLEKIRSTPVTAWEAESPLFNVTAEESRAVAISIAERRLQSLIVLLGERIAFGETNNLAI